MNKAAIGPTEVCFWIFNYAWRDLIPRMAKYY